MDGYCNGFGINKSAVWTAITVVAIIGGGIGFENSSLGGEFASRNGIFLPIIMIL